MKPRTFLTIARVLDGGKNSKAFDNASAALTLMELSKDKGLMKRAIMHNVVENMIPYEDMRRTYDKSLPSKERRFKKAVTMNFRK